MKLFDFELKPIQAITPWGDAGALSLHWFGLTDGYYHLNAGGHELFRYSEEILAHWKTDVHSNDSANPYPDYQVVRLYEDILEMIPCVAQPIPDFIFDQFRTLDSFERLFSRLNEVCDGNDREKYGKFDQIRSFLWTRGLDSGHLVKGPNVWFFRNSDSVYIRWLNEDKLVDGILVWKEIKGEVVIPFDTFIQEVHAFHNELMRQMDLRIVEVKQGRMDPNIRIDIKGLEAEQENRAMSFKKPLNLKYQNQEWERLEMLFKEFASILR